MSRARIHRSLTLNPNPNTPPNSLLLDLSKEGYVEKDDRFDVMHGGRTNQVWQFGNDSAVKVLKLYRPADSNPLFDNNPFAEITSLTALDATTLAPRLLKHGNHPLGRWIIYEHVKGSPWTHDPAPVAKLLARVHMQAPLADLKQGDNGSVEIQQKTLEILEQCQPSRSRDSLIQKRPEGTVPPIEHICLIHRDPVPGNIVFADRGLVLIDWQCPKNGDPSEDLSVFLSPAMQLLYRGTQLTQSEELDFLAAYPNSVIVDRYQRLKSWYHWRMAAYCLWQMGRGNDDYADGFSLECEYLNDCEAPN